MTKVRRLRRDERGATVLEFALAAPFLFTVLVGITQLGVMFFANADLRSAVAAGARMATVYPRPDNASIIAAINEKVINLETARITGPTITPGEDANGNDFAEIEMRYSVPLDFIFFRTPAVTLVERRRVFFQSEPGSVGTPTSSGSTSSGTTTTSTGGTTTSTGGTTTSAGGTTTSTGGTTTTSTGGTTTTSTGGTTTTSTGGTTTSTGGTTTTSTGGNGNGNGNGNGHDHGNGKDKDK